MQRIDAFEKIREQNCNVLICTLQSNEGMSRSQEVKTCKDIENLLQCAAPGTLQLEWQYSQERTITATYRLEDVSIDHRSLRGACTVELRQLAAAHSEEQRFDTFELSAANIRKPLLLIYQPSVTA